MTSTPRPCVEEGQAEGTFLRMLTMVCLVVLVVSGLVVYWIGETTPPPSGKPSRSCSPDRPARRHDTRLAPADPAS